MTITPDKVIRSSFTENLKDDLVAVNAAGHVIGRATTREALERSCPDAAAYFTGKDLDGAPAPNLAAAHTAALDGPLAAIVDNVAPEVMADYSAPANYGAAELSPVLGAVDIPVTPTAGGSLAPSDEDVATASSTPAPVDLDTSASTNPVAEAVDSERKAADGSAFDHDKDGKAGGSRKGADSTAAKGKASRNRKPAR